MKDEARNYLKSLPGDLALIGEATLKSKMLWDKGMGTEQMGECYNHIITANTVAMNLFRNFPLELFDSYLLDQDDKHFLQMALIALCSECENEERTLELFANARRVSSKLGLQCNLIDAMEESWKKSLEQ